MNTIPFPIGAIIVPLVFMTVYAGVAFAVVYFAVRLAIRHESGKKQ